MDEEWKRIQDMKALTTDGIIGNITAKVDGSLGLRVSTPTLTPEEKAMFMELQNRNVKVLIEPLDEPSEEYKIQREMGTKTPGQRLRNTLYVLYTQFVTSSMEKIDFETFYRNEMEKFIEAVKERMI